MTSQFSLKNTGVRRIMEEVNEMKKDPSDQYHAMPLEDNIFDWHFTLRGPKGTDFEGGFFRGCKNVTPTATRALCCKRHK